MKSICALAAVLVIVGAEKRSDFGVFGGQLESGFQPIVGHHDDQYIKSFGITKKVPLQYQLNFEKKVTAEKPHPVYSSKPHQPACTEKKLPQPFTVEKHVLVPVRIPVIKPYPVYVEKKVPYHVEKKIPYFVYKPYPVHFEKPLTYHLKEENQFHTQNQFTYPAEKQGPLQVNNQVHHQNDGPLMAPSYQFKAPQELYAGEGNKAESAVQVGYDGSEFFFGDYFGKGLQQEASGGNIAEQINKQLSARELSNNNKQVFI